MNSPSNIAVRVQGISKSYQGTNALNNISLEVKEAELFGLIGPDGAGKTTLIRILTTLLLADQGKATVGGKDVVSDMAILRSEIGYMPGRFSLYQDLSVEENIHLFASIFGTTVEDNYDQIRDIYSQLEPFKNRRAGALSGGMKQKLALSCALVHQPSILFLDEPTTGVDPVSRREFWQILRRLKEKQITIIVSTPYMDEASLCDRIALIQDGEILSINSPAAVINGFERPLYGVFSSQKYKILEALREHSNTNTAYAFGESVHYTDLRGSVEVSELKHLLGPLQLDDLEVKVIAPSVEDCFMDLMKKTDHG